MRLKQTPSQTVGPFFAYGLTPEQYGYAFRSLAGPVLVDSETPGERIRITGRVLDGEGNPVPDAMIEIWQADGEGRYAHPADTRGSNVRFKGFGRCGTGTDPEHRFTFETIKPGPIGDGQAPHVNVIVFMRGMLSHAYTRMYFDDEAEANARDPVLAGVKEARRRTLIAARTTTPGGTVYRFDVHMQGPDETVFFDI
jgi:protocatechuate 3,4-dioxygenase, alpha subunit